MAFDSLQLVAHLPSNENGSSFRNVVYIICTQTIFYNPILVAIHISTFSKLCKKSIQWYVEECSVALLCN
jgi:hypothetical protein